MLHRAAQCCHVWQVDEQSFIIQGRRQKNRDLSVDVDQFSLQQKVARRPGCNDTTFRDAVVAWQHVPLNHGDDFPRSLAGLED